MSIPFGSLPDMPVIALTGGPGAGKTTGLANLINWLSEIGYHPIVVPELATQVFGAGIILKSHHSDAVRGVSSEHFQSALFRHARYTEDMYWSLALRMRDAGDKIVILCDRGLMDSRAYMDERDFQKMLAKMHLTESDVRDKRYRAALHLRTAALGAEDFYTLANNIARTESPDVARALDERTLQAWVGHPHLRVIDNSTDFAGKIFRLRKEVASVLGIPVPIEIERKFLVEFARVPVVPGVSFNILQHYLLSANDNERVRRRVQIGPGETVSRGDMGVLFHTIKRHIRPGVNVEEERLIDEHEYITLAERADPDYYPIRKRRTCFVYENQYFELDRFADRHAGLALLEVELTEEQQEVRLPPWIPVIREVTDDIRYSNKALARR